MPTLESATTGLRQVLSGDPAAPEWRWQVRGRLSEVREALGSGQVGPWDGWLSARAVSSARERARLRGRVAVLAAGVLERLDTDLVVRELTRLQHDLEHHVQRLHDLLYDSVALEIGGSE